MIYREETDQADKDGFIAKNKHRKQLVERKHNDGAHFNYKDTVNAIIDIAKENKMKVDSEGGKYPEDTEKVADLDGA